MKYEFLMNIWRWVSVARIRAAHNELGIFLSSLHIVLRHNISFLMP